MMEERARATKLSKVVLDLKFMKKSKEKALVQEENEERQQLYQDQLSSLHEGAEKIVMVNSFVDCVKFLPCRLSFGGMDPDVEKLNEDKLMGLYTVVRPPPKEVLTQMDTDISAQEMAGHYRLPANKPTPSYIKEEEAEAEGEEPSSNTGPKSRKRKKPKKSKLRDFYQHDIEGEAEGRVEPKKKKDYRRGKGGGRGGKGRKFNKEEEGKHGSLKGCLGDMTHRTWQRSYSGAYTMRPRGGRRGGRRGRKRSREDSHDHQQGRASAGHDQQQQQQQCSNNHKHKKVKQE